MNTLLARRASVFTLWLLIFVWLPAPTLAKTSEDGSAFCRLRLGLLARAAEGVTQARWRLALGVSGRPSSRLAELLSLRAVRPLEPVLAPALPLMHYFAESSPEFALAFRRFAQGTPPPLAATLLAKFVQSPAQAFQMFRYLGQAGALQRDFARFSEGLEGKKSATEQAEVFVERATAFIKRHLATAIPLAIPPLSFENVRAPSIGPPPIARTRFWDGLREKFNQTRWRLGLLLAGRWPSAFADVLTQPSVRPLIAKLAPAMTELRDQSQWPEFRRGLVRFAQGVPPTYWDAILTELLEPTKPEEAFHLLRALGTVGISTTDFTRLTEGLDKLKTGEKQGKEFKKRAAQLIAERLGNGKGIVNRLFDVTRGLDNGTSGNLFERWVNLYYLKRASGRLYYPTAGLPKKGDEEHSKGVITSDSLVRNDDGAGTVGIVEMKHLHLVKLQPEQLEQARYYGLLIQQKATVPVKKRRRGEPPEPGSAEGKRITKVIYIFSTLDAAQANVKGLREVIPDGLEIRYFDPQTDRLETLK